jgi:predicted dehydrogenase
VGRPHRIGIVGLGVISRAYLDTLAGHPEISIVAVADLDADRSAAAAATIPGAEARTVEDLVNSPDVQTVLNLTVPAAHAEISLSAIDRGKNVYSEKPLAATLLDARAIIDAAAVAQVRVGCAPDTVLGTGTQTARAALDAGLIGRPLMASAVMINPGPERWHPDPDFYYAAGGGPLLDMGPYYIAALVHLLGPIRAVIGASSRLRSERVIGSGPRMGESIRVEVDSHVSGVLEHTNGVLSTIITSFDGMTTRAAPIEVHGDAGTLEVPDPNAFAGEVGLFEPRTAEWRALQPSAGYVDGSRGVGLLDLVAADRRSFTGGGGELALHICEVMNALLWSSVEGQRIELATLIERPSPVPLTPAVEWQGHDHGRHRVRPARDARALG